MCLLALAIGMHPRFPVVIAANRDEYHDRPSAPAAQWQDHPQIVGGRDLSAGGSWMAAAVDGRVALVTNIRRPGATPGRSRGHLVRDCLLAEAQVDELLAKILPAASEYSAFNLIAGHAAELSYIGSDSPEITRLQSGIHTLSNATLNTPWPKAERLRAALLDWCDQASTDQASLFDALADTRPAADAQLPNTGVDLAIERMLSAAFILGDHYGTRCSSIYTLDHAGNANLHERRFGPNGTALGASDLQWSMTKPTAARPAHPLRASVTSG